MVIDPDNKWNFTYMLPKISPDELMQLVVPSCLQMGWCKSASYFCAASETSCALEPIRSLPPHPLEHHLAPPTVDRNHPPHTLTNTNQQASFLHLLEVYINDFIQLTQTTDETQLLHFFHALLHAIHSTSPPPAAMKKLLQGNGLWATCKELLGWVFSGIRQCIELPADKHERIQSELHMLC